MGHALLFVYRVCVACFGRGHKGNDYNRGSGIHPFSRRCGQIEYGAELGLTYVITPWASVPEQPTLDDVKHLADVLIKCGEQVKAAGLKYGYHNRDADFKLVEDKPFIDHLLELVPAELMTMQFDLGWVFIAGYSPADYLKKYKGRVPLTHFKDFTNGRKDAEVGKGKVGYEHLVQAAELADVEFVFVEQEQFEKSSLESAEQNYLFLKNHGLV